MRTLNTQEKAILAISVLLIVVVALRSSFTLPIVENPIIPNHNDWLDQGTILSEGSDGSWDYRFEGMLSPCGMIKKGNTYFLYYIGADGDRSTDGGPRHRSLGVATSQDGITFRKYSNNPVLTYLPHDNEEEGIFSAGVTLDENENVIIYYGAMNAGNPTSEWVTGDIFLAISSDGYNFDEKGMIVSHSNSNIWGYGDELFPTGVFHHDNNWYVYYTAKSNAVMWDIGIVYGISMNTLTDSREVLMSGPKIHFCVPILLDSDTVSLFFKIGKNLEVRTAPIVSPWEISDIIVSYSLDWREGTIFYDREINKWFLCYLDDSGNNINLKIAQPRAPQ